MTKYIDSTKSAGYLKLSWSGNGEVVTTTEHTAVIGYNADGLIIQIEFSDVPENAEFPEVKSE